MDPRMNPRLTRVQYRALHPWGVLASYVRYAAFRDAARTSGMNRTFVRLP
jgi:hypothetical protein